MSDVLYRYKFQPDVPLDDVEDSLLLAIWATEALHGESQVQLDLGHVLDRESRRIVIDASTRVGKDFNRVLIGFLRREFEPHDFTVERIDKAPQPVAA